jgi:hypothetical protein
MSIVVMGARYSAPVRMRSSAKAAALVAPAFAGSRHSSAVPVTHGVNAPMAAYSRGGMVRTQATIASRSSSLILLK